MRKLLQSSLKMLAAVLVIIQLSGCEKESTQAAAANVTIQGLWVGTYSINGVTSLGTQFYSFVLKPDGNMIMDDLYTGQQHLNVGTWKLSGTQLSGDFTCVYGYPQHIGIKETFTATFDPVAGTLVGTWKNVPPLDGSGPFILTKVQ